MGSVFNSSLIHTSDVVLKCLYVPRATVPLDVLRVWLRQELSKVLEKESFSSTLELRAFYTFSKLETLKKIEGA